MADTKNPGPIPPVPGADNDAPQGGETDKNQAGTSGDAFVDIFSSVNLDEGQEGGVVSVQSGENATDPVIQREKKEIPLSENLQQKFQEKANSVAHVMDPTIKGIDDIQAYIEQKKREKKQQTEYTNIQDGIYSADGVDLRQIPGVYAVVQHAKGDHKLVFDAAHAPVDLRPDSAKREKGKSYVKNGNRIYDVELKMMEHPTLKSPDGDPLDVWVIGSPEELTKQMNAIRRGKGGGTNLSDPLVVGVISSEGEKLSQPLEESVEDVVEPIGESAVPVEAVKEKYTSPEITEPDAPEGWIQPKQEEQQEEQESVQSKQEEQEESVLKQEEKDDIQDDIQEGTQVQDLVEPQISNDTPSPSSDESFHEEQVDIDEGLMGEDQNTEDQKTEDAFQDDLGKQDNLASYRGGDVNQEVVGQEIIGESLTEQPEDKFGESPLFQGDLQYDVEAAEEKPLESASSEQDVVNQQEVISEQELEVDQIPEIEQELSQEIQTEVEPQPVLVSESESVQELQLETENLQSEKEVEVEPGPVEENVQDASAIDLDTLSQPVEAQEDISQESQKDLPPKSTIVKPMTIEGILDATATEGKHVVISQPSHTKAVWIRLVVLLILLSGVGVIFTTMFSLENSPLTVVRDMLGLSQSQTGDAEPVTGVSGGVESTGDDTLGRGDGLGTGEDMGEDTGGQISGSNEGIVSGEDVGNDGAGVGGDPVEVSGADAASLYTRDELVIKLEKQQEEARDILYEASIVNNETATIYAKASSLKAQQTKEKALSPDHGALTQEDVFEIIKKIDHYLATARDAIDN